LLRQERAMTLTLPAAGLNPPRLRPWTGHGLAVLMTGGATLVAFIVDRLGPVPNLSLIFVLPVVIAAVSFGWGAALTAVLAGVLAYNFFLIEPRYTLRVAETANVWALVLLLVIAAVVSAVAAQSRRRAVEAWQAADQASAVHVLARSLVGATDLRSIAAICAETVARVFGSPAVVMLDSDVAPQRFAQAGGAVLSDADKEAAQWSAASGLPTRGGAYPVAEADFDFWPVISHQRRRAAIGVRISGRDQGRPPEPERLVEIVGGYLAVALDREAYASEVIETRVQMASERVKADLLAAVSHDLKTPLSTILFTLQSLQTFADDHDAEARRELLALAETEAARLTAMVVNLLDVNRLEAGALAVHPASVSPVDLAASAIHHASAALRNRQVDDAVASSAPSLLVDPALFETALCNVLENAAKYAPAGSAIELRSGDDGECGWIEVLDQGPGFSGPVEPLFEKFARGVEGDGRPPGTGLGLAIARGFMEVQGGGVSAGNRSDRTGAWVRLFAPLAPAAA
jgi:K+-sensing histidine kinase KdpD